MSGAIDTKVLPLPHFHSSRILLFLSALDSCCTTSQPQLTRCMLGKGGGSKMHVIYLLDYFAEIFKPIFIGASLREHIQYISR